MPPSPAAPPPAVESLDDVLADFPRDRPVLYCPNPGNAGDALIAAATFQAFGRLGIPYRVVSLGRFDPAGAFVVYGGGGNFVGLYDYAASFVEAVHGRAERLVVLPHTVRGNEALLARLGPNVTLVAREAVTHAHLAGLGLACGVRLADDVALSADVGALLALPDPSPAALAARKAWGRARGAEPKEVPSPSRAWRNRRPLRQMREQAAAGRPLRFFRRDAEARGPAPDGSHDLSELFSYGQRTPELAFLSASQMLKAVARFGRVETDRLHGCVAAALLGRPVRLHANSYDKNRSVYEQSLRGRFPQVTWAGP